MPKPSPGHACTHVHVHVHLLWSARTENSDNNIQIQLSGRRETPEVEGGAPGGADQVDARSSDLGAGARKKNPRS